MVHRHVAQPGHVALDLLAELALALHQAPAQPIACCHVARCAHVAWDLSAGRQLAALAVRQGSHQSMVGCHVARWRCDAAGALGDARVVRADSGMLWTRLDFPAIRHLICLE